MRSKFTKEEKCKRLREQQKRYYQEKIHLDYNVWRAIKRRIFNKKDKDYPHYGGRGITMCDRWRDSFQDFIEDMRERPSPRYKHSIDRIDVNGNYEPGNCRWATASEQNFNKRLNLHRRSSMPDNYPILYKDKYISVKEFSNITGIHSYIVKVRQYKQQDNFDWIVSDDIDCRYYLYKNKRYNMEEISLITGLKYSVIYKRVRSYLRGNFSLDLSEYKELSDPISDKFGRNISSEIITEIKKLKKEGKSSYYISKFLKLSRNTVMKYWM